MLVGSSVLTASADTVGHRTPWLSQTWGQCSLLSGRKQAGEMVACSPWSCQCFGGSNSLLPALAPGDTGAEGGCPIGLARNIVPLLLPGSVHPFSHLPPASPGRTGAGWWQEGEARGIQKVCSDPAPGEALISICCSALQNYMLWLFASDSEVK